MIARITSSPSADSGFPNAGAARSDAGTSRRNKVAVTEPADEPTMIVADRGSHPCSCSSAASAPAWYA
jgi:hypothetical protein